MLNVRDRDYNVKSFIRLLEQWIMNSLIDIGIKSFLIKGKVGIWVNNEEKIASLGLRIRKGISFHGISLNINPNLEHFSGIIPCGNENSGITSIEKIGLSIEKKEIDKILISNFKKIFEVKITPTQTLS
jgi:lipoyl(octanoyl) transferase